MSGREGACLPILNLLKSFLLLIVCLWGSSFSFLSLQVLLFFAVVPRCFERNRPTPSLHREHTPPGHSIYSPKKVVESRIVQHQLFFYFYPWLLVQLYFSLLLQLHARQVTEPMNLLQVQYFPTDIGLYLVSGNILSS